MNLRTASHRHGAFSLIEILVVIVIIGVLAGLLVPAVLTMNNHTRHIGTQQTITQVHNALMVYRLQTQRFPAEQGVVWTATGTSQQPAWDPAYPAEHREGVGFVGDDILAVGQGLGVGGLDGLLNRLVAVADYRLPGEAMAKKDVHGMRRLRDGWGGPIFYQRFDEAIPGPLAMRAAWWLDPDRRIGVTGTPGLRDGVAVYAPGPRNLAPQRSPPSPADDTATTPGGWWLEASKIIVRKAGE